jgi:cyclohexanone monooxygenase
MGKGVEEITEKGVKANGVEYEVDCIIWSTGFEIGTSWKSRNGYELYGKGGFEKVLLFTDQFANEPFRKGGITLQQKWRKGFKSLFGISTREFPNFAMMQPAQASASINFPLIFGEQAKFFVYLIKACKDQGIEWVDVTEEAEKKWAEEIVEKSRLQKKFLEECTVSSKRSRG